MLKKMRLYVVKADGSKQPFDKRKIMRTCIKLGANPSLAKKIANIIEEEAYDGIETREILQKIYDELGKYDPIFKFQMDLRESLSLLKPKPDFEQYIRIILSEIGFKVIHGQIIKGKCVDHEVDAIAFKDNRIYIVEVKHHYNHHALTGLDAVRILWAVYEDVKEGYRLGLHDLNVNGAMVVSNTKFSHHAVKYAKCKGIAYLGWKMPIEGGIEKIIEERKLYPVTYLKGLSRNIIDKLTANKIITLKELIQYSPAEIQKITSIPRREVLSIINKAKAIIERKITSNYM